MYAAWSSADQKRLGIARHHSVLSCAPNIASSQPCTVASCTAVPPGPLSTSSSL